MRLFDRASLSIMLVVVSLISLGAAPLAAEETLAAALEAVIDAPRFKHAHWGVQVVDLASGAALYERNAEKLFAPASVTKLFTVASALDALGSDYRFQTHVYFGGQKPDEHGVLRGDVILVASGDLSLGGRTDAAGKIAFCNSDHTYADFSETAELTAPDPLAGLNELARQIAACGVKRLEGDVIVDDRLFDPAESTGSGPARLTPMMVNDNLVDILITPAEAGKPASVTWRPQTSAVQVDAQVETVPAGETSEVSITAAGNGRLLARGKIAAGRAPLLRIYEVADPASFARSLLIEALRRAGVTVTASPLESNRPDRLPPVAEYGPPVATLVSPPFAESVRLVLKVSHNLHASTLPLLVAVKNGQRTLADGLRRQHDFLTSAGVDVESISFGGGAGGDRADYVTPQATVQLLRHMAGRPDFDVYLAALPVLGEDGTLARAVTAESAAKGKIQAKTGTLLWSNVMNAKSLLNSKALAGYATTAGGRRLAFAIFVNQVHLDRSNQAQEIGQTLGTLCEAIYQNGD